MGILPGSGGDVDKSAHFLNSANGNGNQSLAKLPDLDQGTVNQTYQGDLGGGGSVFSNPLGPLGKIFGDGILGLPDAFGQLIQALFGTNGPWGTISGAINTIEHNIIGGIQTTISLINAAVNAVSDFVNSIIQTIIRAYNAIPFLGDIHTGGIPALTTAIQDQKANQQNATLTVATGSARNPGWICREPIADVSYIEALNALMGVSGGTGAQSAGTAHTHPLNISVLQVGSVLSSITKGQARGTIITTANPIVYDTVGLILQKFSGATPSPVTVEVYRIDSAGNPKLRLFASGDISSLFTTSTSFVRLPLTTPIVGAPGEQYMVKVLNASATEQDIDWLGLETDTSSAKTGFILTGSAATQTSYTAADIAAATASRLCWAMLAQTVKVPSPASYSDNFDRKTLGGLWIPTSSTGSNQINITANRLAFQSSTNGDQVAIYRDPTDDDELSVEANQYNRVAGAMAGPMLYCNRELTQTMYLGVNASAAKLFVGPWNALVDTGASVATTADDAKWGVQGDPSTATFTILKDGTDVGAWVDTAGLVQFGFDYRWGGERVSRVSGVNGGTQDNWKLEDAA